MHVAARWGPLLRAHGFDTLESLMQLGGGQRMRAVPGRSTVRIELAGPGGGTQVFFLKRYAPEYWKGWRRVGRWLRWPGAQDEAQREWEAIHRLRAHGFQTAEPVAFGQERRGGMVTRSFLLTAEIPRATAAHELLPQLRGEARRRLIRELAEWTARFHGAGFAHKDLYLSHFFVAPAGAGDGPQVFCIDLARLIRPRWLRTRWLIKDLAQLAYSARCAGARRAELLRFYKICFRRARLNAGDRRFIRRVWRRVKRLERRPPRYDVLWDQPGVRPRGV
ncbi:MAG: lipopolysaccharide kinase InaA family protein [Verrucomicrobiales bacterium]|nr:lipopolysaccharide kinase InaA family protein [Verrucomicrobiales bacterium]